MKETEIAVENIKSIKIHFLLGKCRSRAHKESCQRFLEFLKEEIKWYESSDVKEIKLKITDLKNAIKKYDEAGI